MIWLSGYGFGSKFPIGNFELEIIAKPGSSKLTYGDFDVSLPVHPAC